MFCFVFLHWNICYWDQALRVFFFLSLFLSLYFLCTLKKFEMSIKFVYFTIKFCFVSLPTIINSHAKSTIISQLKKLKGLKGNRSVKRKKIVFFFYHFLLIRVLDLVQRQSFLFVYFSYDWTCQNCKNCTYIIHNIYMNRLSS